MGSGFAKQKKQAKLLKEQMMQMQSQMQKTEAVGTAGNGLVTITLSGERDLKSIKIKPECVDAEDIEGLEALIKAAYADACKKLESQAPKLGGGMPDLSMLGF
jgi:hypothetical protein